MNYIFEINDKFGVKINLNKERLKHISKHPLMDDPVEKIKFTLQNPATIRYSEGRKNVRYFYREFKHNPASKRYLLVGVKYLNGNGFIITSFFTDRITGLKWEME